MLSAGSLGLCNSGATLWLGGGRHWSTCTSGSEGQDVLNVIFLFYSYDVCVVMEDSKDLERRGSVVEFRTVD